MKVGLLILLLVGQMNTEPVQWEKYNLTVVSEMIAEDGKGTTLVLKDNSNRKIIIHNAQDVRAEHAKEISGISANLYSMIYIKIRNLEFNIWNNIIHVEINPESFDYKGTDLMIYLPAGVAFYNIDNTLHYKFRILTDNTSFMIKGRYTEEERMIQDILVHIQGVKEGTLKVIDEERVVKVEKEEPEEPVIKTKEKDYQLNHYAQIYIGSGALLWLSYGVGLGNFEISPALGYIYLDDDGVSRQALPVSLRLVYNIRNIWSVEPYVFLGGMYYTGLSNYENKFMGSGGVGIRFYKNYFVEASFISQSDGNGFALGFGYRLDIRNLWR